MKKTNRATAVKFLVLGLTTAWMATATVGCGKKDPNDGLPGATPNSIYTLNPGSSDPCTVFGGCTTQSNSVSGTQVIPLTYAGGLVTLDQGGVAIPLAAGDKVILRAGGNFGRSNQRSYLGGIVQWGWGTSSGCSSISAQNSTEGAFLSIDGAARLPIGPYKYFVSATNSVLRVGLNTSGTNACVAGNPPVVLVTITK